jgi:hypothetical protein
MRYTCATCKHEIPDGTEATQPIGMDGLAGTYHFGCLPDKNRAVNVFTDGIPLENLAPEAHQNILTAARFLSFATLHGTLNNPNDMDTTYASIAARSAASGLRDATQTGNQSTWLQVVRYVVEIHAARLLAEMKSGV